MSWRRHGAIYIFLVLWLVFMAIHGWYEWQQEVTSAAEHGELPQYSDWRKEWLRATFENLQSEAWQVFMSALIIERVVSKNKRFAASQEE